MCKAYLNKDFAKALRSYKGKRLKPMATYATWESPPRYLKPQVSFMVERNGD
jgi:hypothetical protein